MVLALGSGITGVLMAKNIAKDSVEDTHGLLADGFVAVAILHVAGVLPHAIKHRDGIALSMIHGKKARVASEHGIEYSYARTAMLLMACVMAFFIYLSQGFDPTSRTL